MYFEYDVITCKVLCGFVSGGTGSIGIREDKGSVAFLNQLQFTHDRSAALLYHTRVQKVEDES